MLLTRTVGLLVAILLSALEISAAEGGSPAQQTPIPKLKGQVHRLVMPTFPPDALAAGIESVVEIEAIISTRGEVTKVQSVTAKPAHPSIEAASRTAVQQWQFRPVTRRCLPTEAVVTASLEFKLEGGEPKVSLARRPASPSAESSLSGAGSLKVSNFAEVRNLARYPIVALGRRLEADVYGLVVADNRTGTISTIEATAIAVDDDSSREFYRMFENAAKFAMKEMRFTVNADAPEGSRSTICVPFSFRIPEPEAREPAPTWLRSINVEDTAARVTGTRK